MSKTSALLIAVIAWISSKLLIRPILEMTYAADRMSMGELDEPISLSGRDELGLLAASLERLRKSMRSAHRVAALRFPTASPAVTARGCG